MRVILSSRGDEARNFSFFREVFLSKLAWLLIGAILIQQVMVSISIPAIAWTVESISNDEAVGLAFLVLFATLIFPYLPFAISEVVSELYYVSIVEKALKRGAEGSESRSNEANSVLTNEIFRVGRDFVYYTGDLLNVSLSVFLTWAAIIVFVDSRYLLAYFLSIVLSSIAFYFTKGQIAKISVKNQNDRIDLITELNNRHASQKGNDHQGGSISSLVRAYRASNQYFVKFKVINTNLTNVAAALPILIASWVFIKDSDSTTKALIIASTLPRQFTAITYFHAFIDSLLETARIKEQILNMERHLFDGTTSSNEYLCGRPAN